MNAGSFITRGADVYRNWSKEGMSSTWKSCPGVEAASIGAHAEPYEILEVSVGQRCCSESPRVRGSISAACTWR